MIKNITSDALMIEMSGEVGYRILIQTDSKEKYIALLGSATDKQIATAFRSLADEFDGDAP